MWKNLIVCALLAVPSLAVAQEPPPSPSPSPSPPDADEPPMSPPGADGPPMSSPPPVATPSDASPRDLDDPPPPPPPLTPPSSDAPLPRGGPPPPEPERLRPDRSGATFEMSLGLGFTHVSLDTGVSESFNGLSGLNLGVGGWIAPRTALTVRLTGTSFVEEGQGLDVRFIAGLVGLSMQHMVSNAVWIGGGIGLGVLTTDQDNVEPETGLGLDLRAGINLFQSTQNALHLAVEITPGFYDGLTVTGIGLQLGWQSL